jgi:hypothetical protein
MWLLFGADQFELNRAQHFIRATVVHSSGIDAVIQIHLLCLEIGNVLPVPT